MEAGAGKRLLSVIYDGHRRAVEPYALVYKRRLDGRASEYFYVWDRTGGSSSGPGIKTFFHHKIEKLDLLEEVFEPRYPIELAKAGEQIGKGYFGKGFFDRAASRRRGAGRGSRRKSHTQGTLATTYTVECPYCQKRFTRTRPTTKLNPHKDANGWPCGGRTGYLVY